MTDEAPTRVLVVDDDAAQMGALCNMLNDQGYATAGFLSAREALEAMQGQRFDLLLTDLTMPEMGGIDLLRAALEIDGDLVAVMMTGHGTITTAVQAMQVGALDYILKPFKLSAILPILGRALTVRRLRLENRELSLKVSERSAQLEAAYRELEAFSYSVAHDLRAPLRAVDGFSNILLEDFSSSWPPEAQRLLQRITASANHMGQLIDDLLRLSRLGRQPLSLVTVSMWALAQEVVDDIRKDLAGRDVSFAVGDLPEVIGDRALLKQLLSNLLSNAAKFTRNRAQAIIEVGCEHREGEDVFFVRDNGAGFDMQFAQKLFGVFQRLHRAEDFEGTGIGLSIVHRIVSRHGGRVWTEAALDQGATFWFTLPQAAAVRS